MTRLRAAAAANAPVNGDETDSEDVPLEVRAKELRRKKRRRSVEESREDDAPLADLVQEQTAKHRSKRPTNGQLGISGRSLMRFKPSGHQDSRLRRRVAAAAGDDRGPDAASNQGAGSINGSEHTDRFGPFAPSNGRTSCSTPEADCTIVQNLYRWEDSVLEGPFKLVKRGLLPEGNETRPRKQASRKQRSSREEWYILGCRNSYVIGCSQSRSENYQGVIAGIHGALTRGEIKTKSEAHFMMRRMLAPAAKTLRIMDAD